MQDHHEHPGHFLSWLLKKNHFGITVDSTNIYKKKTPWHIMNGCCIVQLYVKGGGGTTHIIYCIFVQPPPPLTYKSWILYVCLSISVFRSHQNSQGHDVLANLDQLKTWGNPILIFKGGPHMFCVSVCSHFQVPESWHFGSRHHLGQVGSWSPIFEILVFKGGGGSPSVFSLFFLEYLSHFDL